MNDFISTVRTDRKREMTQKKESGIIIANEHEYRFVDTIFICVNQSEKLEIGFQANNDDVYFFLIDDGANVYYSVKEIYELLLFICVTGRRRIVLEALDVIINTIMRKKERKDPSEKEEDLWENRGCFFYRGIKYYLKDVRFPMCTGEVEMPDGACRISFLKLFVLINLIQEKSNALFTRGEGKKVHFVNGMVRLLYCLLIGEEDCEVLNRKGWYYDKSAKKFILHSDLAEDKLTKYYLTEDEYQSIIKAES